MKKRFENDKKEEEKDLVKRIKAVKDQPTARDMKLRSSARHDDFGGRESPFGGAKSKTEKDTVLIRKTTFCMELSGIKRFSNARSNLGGEERRE